jgi:hypothetical protein
MLFAGSGLKSAQITNLWIMDSKESHLNSEGEEINLK